MRESFPGGTALEESEEQEEEEEQSRRAIHRTISSPVSRFSSRVIPRYYSAICKCAYFRFFFHILGRKKKTVMTCGVYVDNVLSRYFYGKEKERKIFAQLRSPAGFSIE